jgi:hypothetical protein
MLPGVERCGRWIEGMEVRREKGEGRREKREVRREK